MKKIAILTSILALAACGGGSGSGGSGNGAPGAITTPTDTLTAEQRAAAIASNSQITDMNSFIVIGGTNPTINPNARAATTGVQQSDGGVRYDLSDVEFKTASMLMNTGVDDNAVIKFQIQDGEINGINLSLEGVGPEEELINLQIDANRRDDPDNPGVFAGTGSFQAGDEIESLDADATDFGLLYSSKAKDNNQDLHYADWGVVQWGDIGNYDTSNYFAGGYDVKRTDKNNYEHMNELAQNADDGKLVFSGHADGVVRIGDMSDDAEVNYTEGVNKLTLSSDATLEFASGTSTLTANFDNWYDVSATMDNTGKLTNLVFENGDKEDFITPGENDFKWHGENTYTAQTTGTNYEMPYGLIGDGRTIVRDGFVEYYGDNGNPAEAVGVIRYGDSNGTSLKGSFETSDARSDCMRFDMGFGAKRD